MASALTQGMHDRGHDVEVVTTSLRAIGEPPRLRMHSLTEEVGGITVHYLATPLRYRWMGVTPTLPLELARGLRPDVLHVFGFRDAVTTIAALWARAFDVPYVFEPLGMFEPRVRKVRLKRALDGTLYRSVWSGAEVVVATSEHERAQIVAAGLSRARVEIRGNGFPDPDDVPRAGTLRQRLGLADEPLLLYVGRLARGKGIEFLVAAARAFPDLHVALVGPDDGHGLNIESNPRVHILGPVDDPLPLYGDADVFALPSSSESFGMVAAEAAAAGKPIVVTDRCGVAELLGDAALVVPYDERAVVDAIGRLLTDADLRARLAANAREVARHNSWAAKVERQEELYRLAIERHG
jgi:glycosyltransferase involved in cell wall biosynthesis